jgi:pyrimidine operon attenuation protein/uracil phosphoribosyltransferase
VVLVGLPTRGVPIARRLAARLLEFEGVDPPVGSLDFTLYRDDLALRGYTPRVQRTEIPTDISGRVVVLVDDVLFTGRSTRAALDALTGLGRPAVVQLAVLIDRGHRQLPIRADYVGKNIPTALREDVQVRMREIDGCDEVVIVSGEAGQGDTGSRGDGERERGRQDGAGRGTVRRGEGRVADG